MPSNSNWNPIIGYIGGEEYIKVSMLKEQFIVRLNVTAEQFDMELAYHVARAPGVRAEAYNIIHTALWMAREQARIAAENVAMEVAERKAAGRTSTLSAVHHVAGDSISVCTIDADADLVMLVTRDWNKVTCGNCLDKRPRRNAVGYEPMWEHEGKPDDVFLGRYGHGVGESLRDLYYRPSEQRLIARWGHESYESAEKRPVEAYKDAFISTALVRAIAAGLIPERDRNAIFDAWSDTELRDNLANN